MPTPAWPSTLPLPTLSYPEEHDDPALRSPAEAGYQITRARYTRIRRKWTLEWAAMPWSSYDALRDFFVARAGGSAFFTWTNFIDDTTVTVRFADKLKGDLVIPSNARNEASFKVSCVLEEV